MILKHHQICHKYDQDHHTSLKLDLLFKNLLNILFLIVIIEFN